MGGTGTHVNRHIKYLCGDGVVLQAVVSIPLPPVAVVDGDSIPTGQVGDVQVGIGALADAILRFAPRVPRIIDVATLVVQYDLHSPKEALVRDSTHIVTVTSLRLPLSRICAGPSALGRYPLRSE